MNQTAKYENKDPRCTYPYQPNDPLDYCCRYAMHVDRVNNGNLRDIMNCSRCEFYEENNEI